MIITIITFDNGNPLNSKGEILSSFCHDLDILLSIPQRIFDCSSQPFYTEDETKIKSIIAQIEGGAPADILLFSSSPRNIDFSQFMPAPDRSFYRHNQEA